MSDQTFGSIAIAGKDTAIPDVRYTMIAIGNRNELLAVGLVADSRIIKAARAIISGGAKCAIQAAGGRVKQHSAPDYVSRRNPGNIYPTSEGYTCYTHRLDYGLAHAVFITRMPGFLKVVTDDSLWQELNDTRFTTPILREWVPYIKKRLMDRDLLIEAHVFNAACGVLQATTTELDEIVSEGLKFGDITITCQPTVYSEPEPEVEPDPPSAARSFKVAVRVRGESGPSDNGCRHRTREDAEAAARDLYSRWTLMEGWEIEESEDEPNQP